MATETERRSFSPKEIADRNGIGIATVWRNIAAGKLTCRKLGTRTLIMAEDETAWLNALPVHEPTSAINERDFEKRNEEIIKLYKDSRSLVVVGKKFDLTPERIGQIVGIYADSLKAKQKPKPKRRKSSGA